MELNLCKGDAVSVSNFVEERLRYILHMNPRLACELEPLNIKFSYVLEMLTKYVMEGMKRTEDIRSLGEARSRIRKNHDDLEGTYELQKAGDQTLINLGLAYQAKLNPSLAQRVFDEPPAESVVIGVLACQFFYGNAAMHHCRSEVERHILKSMAKDSKTWAHVLAFLEKSDMERFVIRVH